MTKIVITMEGGMIQNIDSDKEVEIVLIDFDTDGIDKQDLFTYEQEDGTISDVYLTKWDAGNNPNVITHVFKQLKE